MSLCPGPSLCDGMHGVVSILFFYQVILATDSEIAFFYERKRRESRMLSAFKVKHILELLGKLHLPVADPGRDRIGIADQHSEIVFFHDSGE